ncbi:hypothetical protein E9993_11890 [Labilibacter sediminis]|nr:hypothetical protein E9993_11890 [Labilibacter sediminis]
MEILKKKINRYSLGVWIAFLALILICFAWIMQIISLVDWERAIEIGVQDNSFTGNVTERAMADVERGVAVADILWALPLTIIAFIGLLREKFIGFIAAMMTFAICVYFPLFYIFRGSTNIDIVLVVTLLWAVPSLIGIFGLWTNRTNYVT